MSTVNFDVSFCTRRPNDRLFLLFLSPCRPISGYNKIGHDRFLTHALELI